MGFNSGFKGLKRDKKYGCLHEDLYTFMTSGRIIFSMRNISDEYYKENQNTNFMISKFFILKFFTPCIFAVNHFFLFQLNAHTMLNTYIYHQLPPTCFGICYSIVSGTIALLAQKLCAFCTVVILRNIYPIFFYFAMLIQCLYIYIYIYIYIYCVL